MAGPLITIEEVLALDRERLGAMSREEMEQVALRLVATIRSLGDQPKEGEESVAADSPSTAERPVGGSKGKKRRAGRRR
jgi:hypothetical protein